MSLNNLLNNISGEVIKEQRISREECFKLYGGLVSDISTHSLSMWVKSKTNNEFVVAPRKFVLECVIFLDCGVENTGYLERIKMYL